jgi:hypothetical protein
VALRAQMLERMIPIVLKPVGSKSEVFPSSVSAAECVALAVWVVVVIGALGGT